MEFWGHGTARRFLAIFMALGLAACGTAQPNRPDPTVAVPGPTGTPYRSYMVGNPYQISGKTYYPKEDFDYDRTGIASWYGKDFQGKKTANGERYNMNAMTAAHPTLPMPTIARVTNLGNGKSVLVRINDRGPFAQDRIIDLSRRAARELGFLRQGTARVRVTVVKAVSQRLKRGESVRTVRVAEVRNTDATPVLDPKPTLSQPDSDPDFGRPVPASGRYADTGRRIYVQAGAFADRANAIKARRALRRLGKVDITRATVKGRRFYRVQVGPLRSASEGDDMLGRVVQQGYPNAKVVVR